MRVSTKDAYKGGCWAFRNGRSKDHNPYPYMTNSWSWWLAGWNDLDIATSSSEGK